MFKERSTRARLGGSGSGGRGGRRRAVRAARPRGNDPKPFNAIRWLQLVVIGIGILKSSVLVAAGSGDCFSQEGNGFKLKGQCANGKIELNVGDDPELNFNMDFGYVPKNTTMSHSITLTVGGLKLDGEVSVSDKGSKYFMIDFVGYPYPIQGKVDNEGIKLKGNDKSSFTVVVKGSASFDKTWIGYKTSVEYSGQSNLTALSFDFHDVKEYDASKDKMPNYILFSIIGGGLFVFVLLVVGIGFSVWCYKNKKAKKADGKSKVPVPAVIQATTYEGRVAEAKGRAEFLGEPLITNRKLHESFVENRSKPKSKKYSVSANAPLKPLDAKQLADAAKSWIPIMDKTQEESIRTAVEEFRSKETAVEFGHPLHDDAKYAMVIHLLALPSWWQRFDAYFDMPSATVRDLVKEAKSGLAIYRDTFAEGSDMRKTLGEELDGLAKLEVVVDDVHAAKTGAKKFRLPYSFTSAEEMGLLLRPHIIYAACHEPIDKPQYIELQRIITQMEKGLKQLKKPIHGEATAQDNERIKLRTEQLDNLKFFGWISARLLGLEPDERIIPPPPN
ncbi:hypothetical protein M3Y94_00066200 [Aphelenchoides besseyi]|nr:hypothetical protein M3Y94_00066200 [Aphelenchoides besseyi]